MQHTVSTHTRERRALTRVACAMSVTFETGSRRNHGATLCDVGHGGMRIRSARALVPGHFVLVRIPGNAHRGPLELKARVVWSQFQRESRAFESGIRVLYDVTEVGARVAEIVYDALEQSGATAALHDEAAELPLAWSA